MPGFTIPPRVFAHRGASEAFAEHTRAAYLQALADGADGVECDVHLSADGHVVLLHDDDVDRTSSGSGPVAGKTLSELRALDFHSWKGAQLPEQFGTAEEQFLTLAELLDLLLLAGRPLGLAIEFKHPSPQGFGLEEATLELLRERGWDPASSLLGQVQVSFMSFDPQAVVRLAQLVPAELICQLVDEVHPEEIAAENPKASGTAELLNAAREAMLLGARHLDAGVVGLAGPGVRYLRSQTQHVIRWREAGRRFRVWTVDSEEDLKFCLDFGVQEITTNRPAALRRSLELLAADVQTGSL